ncbi:chorismate mutase [Clostridium thailandense]|uniref:chorismate mutase n=1 Tax=Clostridium thailandense TaxID=2794346 RepID=UPI0039898482
MEELNSLRKKIDIIDEEIVRLFEERMDIVQRVAEYKKKNSMEILNSKRESEVIETQLNNLRNKSIKKETEEFLKYIMYISRNLQSKILRQDDLNIETYKKSFKRENKKNPIVGFQGVPASFSHEALINYFGEEIEALNYKSFKDVFEALKNGDIEYGILPIENSSTGGIDEVDDLLREYNFYIVGEKCLKVEHNLLGTKDTEVSDITEVYSHAQGFLQSNKFFEKHDNWKLIPYLNTAKSAKYVSEENNRSKACVASKKAAELYGLKIIEENINYNSNNFTRFIIIAPELEVDRKCNKISIVIALPHKVGTLYNITRHFYNNNLNMTKIESRPVVDRSWEYFFYIDFSGNMQDENAINALKEIEKESVYFKLLGNYKSDCNVD